MATTADVRSGILSFSGTDLTNAELLSLAIYYCKSWGGQWANPWDETENPTEFAAWPTAAEVADFFAQKTVVEWKQRIYRAKLQERQAADAAQQAADAAAEAGKI